jgi:hypothetical protein
VSAVHRSPVGRYALLESVARFHVLIERIALTTRVVAYTARQRAFVRVSHSMNFEVIQFSKHPLKAINVATKLTIGIYSLI